MGAGLRRGVLPPAWKGPRGVVAEEVGAFVDDVVVGLVGREVWRTVTEDISWQIHETMWRLVKKILERKGKYTETRMSCDCSSSH